MPDFSQSFVLAAINAGEIGTIIAVLLAIISWIANIAGGGQKQPPQQQARGRENDNADREFARKFEEIDESEIEVVTESRMDEQRRERLRQRQEQQRQRQQPGQRPARRRHPETRRNQAAEQRRQQAAAQAAAQARQDSSSATSGNLASRQEPGSSDLGAGLQQHLVEYMGDRVGTGVQATGTGVENRHLSKFGADSLDVAPDHAVTNEYALLFRNPDTAKQAMILTEILAKPIALR